jgi:hypothetical protein
MIDINRVPTELIIKLIIDIDKPKLRENFFNSNKRIKKICKDNTTYILGEIFKKIMPKHKKKFDSVIKSIPNGMKKKQSPFVFSSPAFNVTDTSFTSYRL